MQIQAIEKTNLVELVEQKILDIVRTNKLSIGDSLPTELEFTERLEKRLEAFIDKPSSQNQYQYVKGILNEDIYIILNTVKGRVRDLKKWEANQ